jgi:hypothetical protein
MVDATLIRRALRGPTLLRAIRNPRYAYHRLKGEDWRVVFYPHAVWVVERPDLHSRMIVGHITANLPLPWTDATLAMKLYDPAGHCVYQERRSLPKDHTLILETRDLLQTAGVSSPFHGLLYIESYQRILGAMRPYVHYYNEGSLTSTHEFHKYQHFPPSPRADGYVTVTEIRSTSTYETCILLVNENNRRYDSPMHLHNHRGDTMSREISIPSKGTLFESVDVLFPHAREFLEDQVGWLRLDNVLDNALMGYYVGHNKERNTWMLQHL